MAAAATALALVSAWHSGRHVWHRLAADYRVDSALTPVERRHAPFTALELDGNVFDWYGQYLGRGDRVYYQVLPSGLGTLTLPQAVMLAGSYYLLPAVTVGDVRQATAVVSYHSDPAELHVHFLTQQQSGLQPIFVSRIRGP
jgi:hypothetical protein